MVKKLITILFCLALASTSFAAEFDADSDGVFDSTYKFKVDNLVHTATTAVSANVITLLSQADFAGMRTQLSLVPGTNVQAYDADLTTYAGITPSADVQALLGYANFAAIKGGLSIDDLVTLSGVADGATHLGEFTGTTITDNQTIKAALQLLETAVEAAGSGTVTAGTYIDVSGTEVSVDFTETDNITWGAAAGGSQTWTFDTGAGTDPTMAIDETTGFTFNKPVVATSFSTGGSATPGILLQDTDNAAGTATIYGNSSGGANDIILSIGVEDSTGESTIYIEVDGVSETVDFLKPVVATTITTSGNIELGHASDTTIARVSAGVASIEGVNIMTATTAQTWTGANSETITNADDTEIAFNGTESIALDLDTGTANQVAWKNKTTGSSGVTDMSFSALNLATTGSIQGGIKINSDADGMSSSEMTSAGMYGSLFVATGAGTWNLPAAAAGMSFCMLVPTAAAVVINPDDSDVLVYDGTADTAGHQISGGAANGDFICFIAVDTTNWHSMGRRGTWTPGS